MSHDNMGHIVENNVLLHALTNQVEQCSGVEVRRGVAVDDIITTSVSTGLSQYGDQSVFYRMVPVPGWRCVCLMVHLLTQDYWSVA